jgi:hypothetical protein
MHQPGAVIMLGSHGPTPQEQLVSRMQQAATIDLVLALKMNNVSPIILCSPNLDWWPKDIDVWLAPDPVDRSFHFGSYLAETITAHQLNKVLYFGGGSAPLLNNELIEMLVGIIRTAGDPGSRIPGQIVLTNNVHSSDWIGISQARDALSIIQRTERDNSLAWELRESKKYEARTLTRVRPAAGIDIDTPTDLAIIRHHPGCPMHLSQAIEDPMLAAIPVQAVLNVLARSGSHATLIGRVSPKAWETLNKQTQTWLRVFAEERGMVASGRLERGEVRSLIGHILELEGPHNFFRLLAEMTDAAIIDSRVLMAHHGVTPSNADRYASDLYMVDSISDPWLRDFTIAAEEASIPIILGGHSVVSGGLYVLSEILAGGVAIH